MTIQDLAHELGVPTKQMRRRAKRLGIAVQDHRAYVSLSSADQQALRASLTPQHTADDCRLPDTPGLPLEALSDPAMRETFTLLRFEREARLMALVRPVTS